MEREDIKVGMTVGYEGKCYPVAAVTGTEVWLRTSNWRSIRVAPKDVSKPAPMPKVRMTSPSTDRVGDVELHGMYGGALCWHYRIEKIEDGRTTLVRVEPRSVKNDNGTFSTEYEVVR